MSISDKIEKQKAELIDKHINSYKTKGVGLSKALKLMYQDIEKMRDDKLTLSEQIDILNGIFDVSIKYDTYKKWSKRHFKKNKEFVENSSHKNKKKTSNSFDEMKQKTEVETVTRQEPNNEDDFNLNETFERKTKPKFKGLL